MLAIELADKEWLYDMLNGDPVPLIPKVLVAFCVFNFSHIS